MLDNQYQQQKKRTIDPTLALLKTLTLVSDRGKRNMTGQDMTTNEIARKELEYYGSLPEVEGPQFEEILGWWNSRVEMEKMTCLSQVAKAVLACAPSSGGTQQAYIYL
jgi:hypothetical protein